MILPYFQELTRGLEARLQETPEGQPTARKKLALELARLGERLFSPEHKLAWGGVLVPFDLLNAMGITGCFVEFVGAMLSSTGAVDGMLEGAEAAGYSTDVCAYHRAVNGAQLAGLMPEPSFLLATSAPCTGGIAVLENLARTAHKPLFVLQIPQADGEASVRFLAAQLREMTAFIEAGNGPLDPAALRRAIERTNEARALLLEVFRLAQSVPTPARPRDLVNLGIVISLLMGTDAAVEVARTYRDELTRSAARAGARPPERARLMWLQNRIQFKNPLEKALTDANAFVVVDELNDITWEAIDPDDPYPGLARRILSIPLTGSVARRTTRLRQLARAYRVDGAINPCHWGCRQGTGARGMVEQALREEGVPVLNLEVDCVDPRNFAEGQLRTRVEAFLEMLDAKPRGSRREVAS